MIIKDKRPTPELVHAGQHWWWWRRLGRVPQHVKQWRPVYVDFMHGELWAIVWGGDGDAATPIDQTRGEWGGLCVRDAVSSLPAAWPREGR